MAEVTLEYLTLVMFGLTVSSQSKLIIESLIAILTLQRSDIVNLLRVLLKF